MEQSGRNRWQTGRPRKRLNEAKSVAVGCDRLPSEVHGKEGVDGSSPSEGSARHLQIGRFPFSPTCRSSSVRWVWSRLWSFQFRNALPHRGEVASRSTWLLQLADRMGP